MSVNKNKGQREIILSLNFKEIQRMYDFILLNNADIDSVLSDVKLVDAIFKEKIQDNLQHEFLHIRQLYFSDAKNNNGISD